MAFVAILIGFALGLSLAAPPGPMNALIAREASRHGVLPAVRVGLGAPVADYVYLLLLVLGARAILEFPGVIPLAAAVGAFLMGAFGWSTLFLPASDPKGSPGFWGGFAMAMTNPYQIAWWLTGGFIFLQSQGWWGILGLTAGIFGWVFAFAWLVAHGARRWSWFAPAVRFTSAGLLFMFSLLLVGVALQVVTV